MCLAFHIWALLLGKEGEAAGWNIALHACATRRAHGSWELAWGRPQCMACKSTMIRAVGLGREPTGVILMAGGWAQGASFPAGVPRLAPAARH
jgi:hypothetical protein